MWDGTGKKKGRKGKGPGGREKRFGGVRGKDFLEAERGRWEKVGGGSKKGGNSETIKNCGK